MSNVPNQVRSIDAFSSYHSNITNRLTRIVSKGENVILSKDSMQLSFDDSTANHIVTISPGYIIKDDVLIYFDQTFDIDMSDSEFYRSGTTPFDETGIYYITVAYAYQKTKPPPEAKIIILKPSEEDKILESYYFFIGAVEILDSGTDLYIEDVFGYDPDNPDVTRNYPRSDTKIVATLPGYDSSEHEGSIIYDLETGFLYWGSPTGWINIRASGEIVLDPDDTNYKYLTDKTRYSLEVVEDNENYYLQLKNDNDEPGQKYVYATNDSGVKGWYSSTEIGGYATKTITSDYTANANEILLIGDSTGVLTITLSDSPQNGDRVEVVDAGRLFSVDNVIVDGNGKTISNQSTYTLDVDNARYIFTYYSETGNWIVSMTSEEAVVKSITHKILPYEMSLDDSNVGSDGGNIFGIIESIDFDPSEDGSVWMPFRINISNVRLGDNIKLEILYSLNGNDSDKDVDIEIDYWILDPNSTYDSSTPDDTISDIIVSGSSNIGKLDEIGIDGEITGSYLTEDTEMIIIKFTRSATTDDYSGTLQLASLKLYQES